MRREKGREKKKESISTLIINKKPYNNILLWIQLIFLHHRSKIFFLGLATSRALNTVKNRKKTANEKKLKNEQRNTSNNFLNHFQQKVSACPFFVAIKTLLITKGFSQASLRIAACVVFGLTGDFVLHLYFHPLLRRAFRLALKLP